MIVRSWVWVLSFVLKCSPGFYASPASHRGQVDPELVTRQPLLYARRAHLRTLCGNCASSEPAACLIPPISLRQPNSAQ